MQAFRFIRTLQGFMVLIFLLTILSCSHSNQHTQQDSELDKQLSDREIEDLKFILKESGHMLDQLHILLVAYKAEEILELWGRDHSEESFSKIKNYKFCKSSGTLGPKRKEGDLQIPEGVYHINRFNPNSQYFLSLGINYPNESDRIRGDKEQPGSDIFIHGDCVTVGCIPITDKWIRELYFIADRAKENGQLDIPVLIFPFIMSGRKMKRYKKDFQTHARFWDEMKPFHDYFLDHKRAPKFTTDPTGRYVIN